MEVKKKRKKKTWDIFQITFFYVPQKKESNVLTLEGLNLEGWIWDLCSKHRCCRRHITYQIHNFTINNVVKFRYEFMLTFAQYFHSLNIMYALKQVCLLLESYSIVYCIHNSLDTVQLAVEYIKCNTHTTTNHLLHMQKNTHREKQTHSHSCPHLPCGYIDMLHAVLYKHVDTHTGIQLASVSLDK